MSGMVFLFAGTMALNAEIPVSVAGGSYEAWQKHRDAMIADKSLVRYYTFDDVRSPDASVSNQAGSKTAPLIFKVDQKKDVQAEQLRIIEGRWPGKKAVRLDQGHLAAEQFDIVNKAFTVEAWFRKNGAGVWRGNNESTNGTLLSVGSGYWDGWRLTTACPAQNVSFEIGRPKPGHSIGIRTTEMTADGVWHHLTATWDGRQMRIYIDGLLTAVGEYNGDYAPSARGAAFRIGYANSGVGSVILDVDEVAVYNRALLEEEVLHHAYFHAPLSRKLAERFQAANRSFDEKNYIMATEQFETIVKMRGVHPDLIAMARLRLSQSLREQRNLQSAVAELVKLLKMDGISDVHQKTALTALLQLIRRGAGGNVPAGIYHKVLSMSELTTKDKFDVQLNLARSLRQQKNYETARQYYSQLLESPDAASREKLNIRLELAHICWEGGNYENARAEYSKVMTTADVPAHYRSIAQLRIAASYVQQKNNAAAKAGYAKVMAMSDAPSHHKWEAQERIRELERIEAGLPPRDPATSRIKNNNLPKPAVELFVSQKGSDTNPGDRRQPFATLERARDEIRKLKKNGTLPTGGIAVYVRYGEYKVTRTFKLTAEDSGTEGAPIVYRAYGKEAPRFTGGIGISGFTRVTDPAVLSRLPEESRGKVWQVDLKAQGISDIPAFEPKGTYGARPRKPLMELFFNGRPMEVSRWPNDSFVNTGEVLGPTETDKRGRLHARAGQFIYDGDRPLRWKNETNIWLYGYWYHDWADSYEKVASIDTEQRIVSLAPPLHSCGFAKGRRYYTLNLLSEIDRPGEWYLDHNKGVLYLWPPSNPNRATVEISIFSSPFMEVDNVTNVVLRGLTWELGRGDGLSIKGGERCLLAGCTIRNFAGDGIVVEGGKRHGLFGCDIYAMGRGGTIIRGGDRKTLTPSGHFIENCHIYNVSRIDHTYTPAVLANGVGMHIAHNLMHDIGSSAMRVEGNDHLVEFNEVHNVVRESDDQGGVDVYGNPTYRGNVYRFNFFHDIGSGRSCGQAGIRLDDAISGTLIYGNVFWRCAESQFGGVQIHGGKDNWVDNNIFVDCKQAISFSAWGQKRWEQRLGEDWAVKALRDVDITQPPYSTRYPELATLRENADSNHIWRSLVVNCGQFTVRDRGVNDLADNYVTSDDPGFVNAVKGDFRLKISAEAFDRLALSPIPFDEIGLYKNDLRASWPVVRRK